MGQKMDLAARGVSMTGKLLVTALWVLVCVGGFAGGAIWVGLLAIAYLVYLWAFSGRWLIY